MGKLLIYQYMIVAKGHLRVFKTQNAIFIKTSKLNRPMPSFFLSFPKWESHVSTHKMAVVKRALSNRCCHLTSITLAAGHLP